MIQFSAQHSRPQYEALGNKPHKLCSFCFTLKFALLCRASAGPRAVADHATSTGHNIERDYFEINELTL